MNRRPTRRCPLPPPRAARLDQGHYDKMRAKRGWSSLGDYWDRASHLQRRGSPDDFAKWCGADSAEQLDGMNFAQVASLPIFTDRDVQLAGGSFRAGTGENEGRVSVFNDGLGKREMFVGHGYGIEKAYLAALATAWEMYSLRANG